MRNIHWVIVFAAVVFLNCFSELQAMDRENQIIAAIKDSGCSTHPHKVIEQKDIQVKDTYNMKGFE